MITILLLSFLLGLMGAWLLAIHGHTVGLTDSPTRRSSHRYPTPKGGGIGIMASLILAGLLLGIPMAVWLPVAIVSMLSLWGDYVHLAPGLRLSFQTALAGVVCVFYLSATDVVSLFLFVVFVVGTANFYNFMDGINGIAAISAIVGFGLMAAHRFLFEQPPHETFFILCVVFACAGFLPFNIPRAKVFMGDVGSVLLGFLFAVMLIKSTHSKRDFLVLISFLFTFYADEITTMFVRLKRGENLFKPHRLHLYQLLANEMGMNHMRVSMIFGLIQLLVGCSMLLLRYFGVGRNGILSVFIVYCIVFCIVSVYIRRRVRSIAERR